MKVVVAIDSLKGSLSSMDAGKITASAINDLDNTTVSYDRERVQSSGVSNPVQRIIEKIDDPKFMGRKQAEMDKDKAWCEQELAYICWKISIVHRARDDEMSKWEKQVFKYTFIDGLDYRGIRRKCL